jgi:hypothetical protein
MKGRFSFRPARDGWRGHSATGVFDSLPEIVFQADRLP